MSVNSEMSWLEMAGSIVIVFIITLIVIAIVLGLFVLVQQLFILAFINF